MFPKVDFKKYTGIPSTEKLCFELIRAVYNDAGLNMKPLADKDLYKDFEKVSYRAARRGDIVVVKPPFQKLDHMMIVTRPGQALHVIEGHSSTFVDPGVYPKSRRVGVYRWRF